MRLWGPTAYTEAPSSNDSDGDGIDNALTIVPNLQSSEAMILVDSLTLMKMAKEMW